MLLLLCKSVCLCCHSGLACGGKPWSGCCEFVIFSYKKNRCLFAPALKWNAVLGFGLWILKALVFSLFYPVQVWLNHSITSYDKVFAKVCHVLLEQSGQGVDSWCWSTRGLPFEELPEIILLKYPMADRVPKNSCHSPSLSLPSSSYVVGSVVNSKLMSENLIVEIYQRLAIQ